MNCRLQLACLKIKSVHIPRCFVAGHLKVRMLTRSYYSKCVSVLSVNTAGHVARSLQCEATPQLLTVRNWPNFDSGQCRLSESKPEYISDAQYSDQLP